MANFVNYGNAETLMTEIAAKINNSASSYAPLGTVVPYAGNTAPNGWLVCNGAAVSREMYADLFAVIGTTYGAGDGAATFNLPNLVDKFVEGGSSSGAIKSAGLPNITGQLLGGAIHGSAAIANGGNGAFTIHSGGNAAGFIDAYTGTANYNSGITFNASKSNSIYGSSTTVQPPAVVMVYIIKASIVADVSDGEEQRFSAVENDVAENTADIADLQTVTSGTATLASGILGAVTWYKIGRIVFVRVNNVRCDTSAIGTGATLATNLPKPIYNTSFNLARYPNEANVVDLAGTTLKQTGMYSVVQGVGMFGDFSYIAAD